MHILWYSFHGEISLFFSPFELGWPVTALTTKVWHTWCYVSSRLRGQSTSILVSGRPELPYKKFDSQPLAREAAWKGYINRERKVQLIQTGIWIKSPWTLQTSQLRAEYPVGITWSRKKSVNQAFPRFLIHKIKLYNIFFSILRQKFKKQKEEREIKKKGGTYLQLKIISLYIP